MRKVVLLLILVLVPVAVQAQQDPDWRNRRGHDRYDRRQENQMELTFFGGYRYGGTLYADTSGFNQDVKIASSPNFGASLGIPLGNMLKLELSFDRQNTHLTSGGGFVFSPDDHLAGFSGTYYQAGLQIPFSVSRGATPYFIVGAGVASLKPKVDGVSAANRFAADAGVGVKIPINRNAGLRVEARGLYASLSDYNNCDRCYADYGQRDLYQGETNFGLYFSF
jgi:hypothetical protein